MKMVNSRFFSPQMNSSLIFDCQIEQRLANIQLGGFSLIRRLQ